MSLFITVLVAQAEKRTCVCDLTIKCFSFSLRIKKKKETPSLKVVAVTTGQHDWRSKKFSRHLVKMTELWITDSHGADTYVKCTVRLNILCLCHHRGCSWRKCSVVDFISSASGVDNQFLKSVKVKL